MNRKMSNKTAIYIVAGVVVLALVALTLIFSTRNAGINNMNSTVKNVSLDFLQSVKSGNIDQARTYLSVEGLKEYDAEKLKQIPVPELTMKGEPEASGSEATIVHGNKDEKKYIKLTLVKEKDKWKVSKILNYTLSY